MTRESVCTRPGPTPPKHPQHKVAKSDYEGVVVTYLEDLGRDRGGEEIRIVRGCQRV